ncbi:unnamed protein product [Bemisia tabaci]|uniref:Uncharacterized protein n=1 Tax=Bemisia tabaci TaxID=7038 RepID=A0A9P0EVS3_BEMTA|nr:unnamed protein product [Bemisia tabaci]
MDLVKPIFRDLANPELLKKCLHSGTQNPNDSLSDFIWSRIPKRVFVMRKTLEFGVLERVACSNEGNIVKCHILDNVGTNPGIGCINAMKNLDLIRIKKAEKAIDAIEMKCRQARSAAKKKTGGPLQITRGLIK